MLLTYEELNNQPPSYLKDVIEPYYPSKALHFQSAGLLSSPLLWNQLPIQADTLTTFKIIFKTFYFNKAYS